MRWNVPILAAGLVLTALLTTPAAQAETCVSLAEGALYACDDLARPTRVGSAPAATELAVYRCGPAAWTGLSGVGGGCVGGAVEARVAGVGLPTVPLQCYGGTFQAIGVFGSDVFLFGMCPGGAGLAVGAGLGGAQACLYYFAVLATGQVACVES